MASDALKPISGTWRAEGHASGAPALLKPGPDKSLVVTTTDGKQLARVAASAVNISDRVGRIPRHVVFPGAGDFETADNDGVDTIERMRAKRNVSLVHELEQFRPRLMVFVLATIALAIGIYRYAVPVLVEVAIWATPPAVGEVMSQSVIASLDNSILAPSKLPKERQDALEREFKTLVATAQASDNKRSTRRNYNINFRDGGYIGPNAFALPDGTVLVTDQLVDLAGDNNELVVGVLGHEIGHVEHDHSLRQLYRAAGVTALIMMIGGDIGDATQDVLVQGTALLQLSHSRGAEAEADRFGVDLLNRAGKDPLAVSRFFEMLRDKMGDTGENDFFSTHPATTTRIEDTRKLAERVKAGEKITD